MQTQKMSLANIKGKLSRTEMKNIMTEIWLVVEVEVVVAVQ